MRTSKEEVVEEEKVEEARAAAQTVCVRACVRSCVCAAYARGPRAAAVGGQGAETRLLREWAGLVEGEVGLVGRRGVGRHLEEVRAAGQIQGEVVHDLVPRLARGGARHDRESVEPALQWR